MSPGVLGWEGVRIHFVEDGTSPGNLLGPLADLVPVTILGLTPGDEIVEFSLRFQFDLQLGNVMVLGIAKLSQQDGVNNFADLFRCPLHRSGIHRDVEHDDLRRYAGVDEIDPFPDPPVIHLVLEQLAGRFSQNIPVSQNVSQILGKGRLTGTEEPGDPDTYPFVRLLWSVCNTSQYFAILVLDPVRSNVLRDLRVDGLFVSLVDFDDFFDFLCQVTRQKVSNCLHHSLPYILTR